MRIGHLSGAPGLSGTSSSRLALHLRLGVGRVRCGRHAHHIQLSRRAPLVRLGRACACAADLQRLTCDGKRHLLRVRHTREAGGRPTGADADGQCALRADAAVRRRHRSSSYCCRLRLLERVSAARGLRLSGRVRRRPDGCGREARRVRAVAAAHHAVELELHELERRALPRRARTRTRTDHNRRRELWLLLLLLVALCDYGLDVLVLELLLLLLKSGRRLRERLGSRSHRRGWGRSRCCCRGFRRQRWASHRRAVEGRRWRCGRGHRGCADGSGRGRGMRGQLRRRGGGRLRLGHSARFDRRRRARDALALRTDAVQFQNPLAPVNQTHYSLQQEEKHYCTKYCAIQYTYVQYTSYKAKKIK